MVSNPSPPRWPSFIPSLSCYSLSRCQQKSLMIWKIVWTSCFHLGLFLDVTPSVTTHSCAVVGLGVEMILAGWSRSATVCETMASVTSTIFHLISLQQLTHQLLTPCLLSFLSSFQHPQSLNLYSESARCCLMSSHRRRQSHSAMLSSRESLTL